MLYVHYTGCKFTNKFAARQSFRCFFSEMVSWQEGIGYWPRDSDCRQVNKL